MVEPVETRSRDRSLPATSLVTRARTRIEATFDPVVVRQLNATAGRDVSVGGPDLASHAIKAGLVVEYHAFVTPIAVGSGTRFLPVGVRVKLELQD